MTAVEAAQPAQSRFYELDGLRGIAAFAVVIYHLSDSSAYPGDPDLFYKFHWGQYGVQLFFLISGFVILVSARRSHRPTDFLISRASRLYPPYWIALTFTAAAALVVGVPTHHDELSPLAVVANYTMLQRWLNIANVDEVYWTLGVELQFYAVVFLLLALTGCRLTARVVVGTIGIWIAASLLVAVWAAPNSHNLNPMAVAGSTKLILNATITPYGSLFCVGMLAYLARNREIPRWPAVAAGVAASLQYGLVQSTTDAAVVGLLIAVFLLVAWRTQTRALTNSAALWLGRRSYSLYIGHLALGRFAIHYLLPYVGRTWATAFALVAVGAWASVLYEFGEQRGSRWLRERLVALSSKSHDRRSPHA